MPPVIKANDPRPTLARRLETVNVADHMGEARLVLKRSREEARQVLKEAHVQAETIHREAEEKGYEAGFRRGYQAGAKAGHDAAFTGAQQDFSARQVQLTEALETLIQSFEDRKRDLFIEAQCDVADFAMRVAEKVTCQVGAVHPEAAVANLEAALRLVEGRTDLTVRVNPQDHSTLEKFAQGLVKAFAGARHWQVVADDGVAPGGCRLACPDVEVDATIETQLEQLSVLMVGERVDRGERVERSERGDRSDRSDQSDQSDRREE